MVGWPIGCVMLEGVTFQRCYIRKCQRQDGVTFLPYEYHKWNTLMVIRLKLSSIDNCTVYLYLICFRICSHPCLYKRVHSALKIHSLVKSSSIIILGLGSRRHFQFFTDIYRSDYFHWSMPVLSLITIWIRFQNRYTFSAMYLVNMNNTS